jgi:hypothetical protein
VIPAPGIVLGGESQLIAEHDQLTVKDGSPADTSIADAGEIPLTANPAASSIPLNNLRTDISICYITTNSLHGKRAARLMPIYFLE